MNICCLKSCRRSAQACKVPIADKVTERIHSKGHGGLIGTHEKGLSCDLSFPQDIQGKENLLKSK